MAREFIVPGEIIPVRALDMAESALKLLVKKP